MRTVIWFLLLPMALLGVASTPAGARTWTDRTGRQLEADFVGFVDGKVQIKRTSDGKTFFVPIDRFSDADQAFVRSQTKPDTSPPKADTSSPAPSSKKPKPEKPGAKELTLIPPDDSVQLPKDLRDSAAQAYKQGFRFFVWVPEKGPFIREATSNVLVIPLNYICEGEPVPFGTSFTIIRKDGEKLIGDELQLQAEQAKYSSRGKTPIIHFDFFRQYSGKGAAKVFLHDLKTRKPISNDVVVEIELR